MLRASSPAPTARPRHVSSSWSPIATGALALASLLAHVGCSRSKVQEPETRSAAPTPPPPATASLSPRLARPAAERVVAIGDLHGDLDHARRALRLAGAIDDGDRWIGGHLVVVQTGDQVDRGDDDRSLLDLIESLKTQAAAAGGELIALLGNHEIMNAELDFRYVTPRSFEAFALLDAADASLPEGRVPPSARGRAAAFAPGGSYASVMSHHPLLAKVGDTLFVHGGILPKHVAYGLDRMNDEVDDWLARKRKDPPAIVVAEDGPVWTRVYSDDDATLDCPDLARVLDALGAKRMVVGHTVQHAGVNSACGGNVWRIDVGLSRFYGGPIQALELRGGEPSVLREAGK